MGLSLDFRQCQNRERQRLEALVGCLQTFVGHELPNALVGLQGIAQLLLDQGDCDEESRPLLERLAALAQKADRTSRRVAELGRLVREPSFGPAIELTDAVREATAEVNARRPPSPIALDVPESLPAVPLAQALLHAVLVQLLTNAAQAGIVGQTVPVHVEARHEGDDVWLSLQDKGRGMSEAQLALLREPFAAGRQPGASRVGLGFFLVCQGVAKWGGAVQVESKTGRGTTVSLFLPISDRSKAVNSDQ